MSNESNREDRHTQIVSPGDLQASDFFPPGTGWNKDDSSATTTPSRQRDCQDEESAVDGGRPH
jgi:hypothetical protein